MNTIFIVLAATLCLVSSAPYASPGGNQGVVLEDFGNNNEGNVLTKGGGSNAPGGRTNPPGGGNTEDCDTEPETNYPKYEEGGSGQNEPDSCEEGSERNGRQSEGDNNTLIEGKNFGNGNRGNVLVDKN